MKILNKAVGGIAKKLGVSYVTGKIRDVAEGRMGTRAHDWYWGLVGYKRLISLLFGLLGVTLIYAHVDTAGTIIATLGTVGIAGGILDSDWRAEKPVWIESTKWWRFLADNSATITTLWGMAAAACATCSQQTADALLQLHMTCTQGTWALGLISALCAFTGLKDQALRSAPPEPS